jgi:YidC/Oxa1 family membrane protein insertase
VTTNLFTFGQQMWVLRKYPPLNANARASVGKQTVEPVVKVKAGDKSGDGASPVASRAVAPKVGAKPVNPKKGGAVKQ